MLVWVTVEADPQCLTCTIDAHAGHDRDEEDARGIPAVPQPVSPVRMPAPMVTHTSAPPQHTSQAQRADAMLKALQIVRSKGKERVLGRNTWFAESIMRMLSVDTLVQACASSPAMNGGLTCSKCEGGVEAMAAEQSAARKHASAALAAVRTSAVATTSSARPVVTSGITHVHRWFCQQIQTSVNTLHKHPRIPELFARTDREDVKIHVCFTMYVMLTAGQGDHQHDLGSNSAAKPALEPKAFFSAQPSRPAGGSSQPSSAGSRERLTAKLGLAPKSRRPPGAGKPTVVICQPGQSGTSLSLLVEFALDFMCACACDVGTSTAPMQ